MRWITSQRSGLSTRDLSTIRRRNPHSLPETDGGYVVVDVESRGSSNRLVVTGLSIAPGWVAASGVWPELLTDLRNAFTCRGDRPDQVVQVPPRLTSR